MSSEHIVRPGEGERLERGPRHHRVLADLPEVEVVDACFGPGFKVPEHHHDDHVDSFYVLEGEIEVTLGDETLRAGPGTWVSAPVGVRHSFRNAGEGDLRILNIHAPNTGFVDWMRTDP